MPNLTSESLLFHSFPHSQGDSGAQLGIFRYMDLQFGIRVDLHPSPKTQRQLVDYVSGIQHSDRNPHIKFGEYPKASAEAIVFHAIKELRKLHNTAKYGKILRANNMASTLDFLLDNIVDKEFTILGREQSWSSPEGGGKSARAARLEDRVKAGKASFLLYYGRDRNRTSWPEFDQMYADLWQRAMEGDPEDPEYWEGVITDLNDTVALHEADRLGKLCLARGKPKPFDFDRLDVIAEPTTLEGQTAYI